MEMLSFNIVEIVLLSSLGLFLFIQILYQFYLYNRIHAHNKAVKKGYINFVEDDALPPVSVIIRACNESDNLKKNLEAVLQQDYPKYEVIVVNDGSTDESESFLVEMEAKYDFLYHSFTPEQVRNLSSKKLALTIGIKASKYDWLVFTEANCHPDSNQWLRSMARNFTSTTDIVLGYSNYKYKKGWMNKLACFDMLIESLRYLGMALNSKTYKGVGRNLAYRKKMFYEHKGFSKFLELFRGEDDLFINNVANDINTRVETSKDSIVWVDPVEYSTLDWKKDKVSYIVTSHYYKGSQNIVFGFDTFARILFIMSFLSTVALGILNFHWLVVAIAFIAWLTRYIIAMVVVNNAARDMKEERRYFLSLLYFELLLPWQSLSLSHSHLARKENNCVYINNPTHNAWS